MLNVAFIQDDKLEFADYKALSGDGIDEVDIEVSSKLSNVSDSQHLEEDTVAFTRNNVNSEVVASAKKKTSFTKEITSVSATDTTLPAHPLAERASDQILSMMKLEDIENFMDTLLESKSEESILEDASQNIVFPHEAELSTAKPITDVQLMDELNKINEKLLSISEHKSSSNSKKDNEEVEKRVNPLPCDSCFGNFYFKKRLK